MSREELVSAYLDGNVSRRTFVRRLVASGVSLTAALVYVQLQPERARAAALQGHYGHYSHYGQDCHSGHGGGHGRHGQFTR